jgi:hypothetical protein
MVTLHDPDLDPIGMERLNCLLDQLDPVANEYAFVALLRRLRKYVYRYNRFTE